MNRNASPHTLRKMAERAFRNRARGGSTSLRTDHHLTQDVADKAHADAARAVQIADLPYLARRVLRIVAAHQEIGVTALEREADLDRCMSAREQADLLILFGLVARSCCGQQYSITEAGALCVDRETQRSRAKTSTGATHHA